MLGPHNWVFRENHMKTIRTHYDALSRALHWLTAIAVLIAFILGPEHFGREMRQGLDPATRLDIVAHESLGVLVMALTLLRLLWVAVRPAKPQFDMTRWMHITAQATHGLLWLLLLAVPFSALLALASAGHLAGPPGDRHHGGATALLAAAARVGGVSRRLGAGRGNSLSAPIHDSLYACVPEPQRLAAALPHGAFRRHRRRRRDALPPAAALVP